MTYNTLQGLEKNTAENFASNLLLMNIALWGFEKNPMENLAGQKSLCGKYQATYAIRRHFADNNGHI